MFSDSPSWYIIRAKTYYPHGAVSEEIGVEFLYDIITVVLIKIPHENLKFYIYIFLKL